MSQTENSVEEKGGKSFLPSLRQVFVSSVCNMQTLAVAYFKIQFLKFHPLWVTLYGVKIHGGFPCFSFKQDRCHKKCVSKQNLHVNRHDEIGNITHPNLAKKKVQKCYI